jgi:hypothetical protein
MNMVMLLKFLRSFYKIEENTADTLHKQRHKDKIIQCICKIFTTMWVTNLAGYM